MSGMSKNLLPCLEPRYSGIIMNLNSDMHRAIIFSGCFILIYFKLNKGGEN